MPVPATKSLYLRCAGAGSKSGSEEEKKNATKLPQSVSIRFTIMEVDKFSIVDSLINASRSGAIPSSMNGLVNNPNLTQQQSLPQSFPSVSSTQSHQSNTNTFTLLSRAFSLMDRNRPMSNKNQPNHSHSVDMEFLLADRQDENEGNNDCGNYLQYGYYFFLSDKVDAKLYAQTCSSSQSIPLLLKREGFTKRMEKRNEKEYFPLNGVSYLVAKVSRGCKHADSEHENLPALRMDHKRRLDHIMQMNQVIDMVSSMQKTQETGLNTNLAIKASRNRFSMR